MVICIKKVRLVQFTYQIACPQKKIERTSNQQPARCALDNDGWPGI